MSTFKKAVQKRLLLIEILLCSLTVSGFLGGIWWAFELTAHFRVQYLIILFLILIISLLLKSWKMAVIAMVFALINASLIAPLYWGQNPPKSSKTYRAVLVNVNTQNKKYQDFLKFIRESEP